jgi:hypothetical protein
MRLEMNDESCSAGPFSGSSAGVWMGTDVQSPCPVGEASGVTMMWGGGKPAKAGPLPFRLMRSLPTPQSPGLGVVTADGPAAGLACT